MRLPQRKPGTAALSALSRKHKEEVQLDTQMFCYQCEQTAGGKGCTKAGVCGKKSDIAGLQDQLTGALVGLARTTDGNTQPTENTYKLLIKGLFTTITNVNFNDVTLKALIDEVHAEKEKLVPLCGECASPCGRNDDYDMTKVWDADEDIRSLKSLILFGVRGMAAYAYHAGVLGYSDQRVNEFIAKALFAIGEEWGMDELLPIVLEVGEVNFICMEMLDKANTDTYGKPVPATVPLMVEKGPFIVITGHDLYDLKQLLEQTKDKGINIYTHGEMLPAHGYPELKKYPHLKGNFGTAWQNQQKEFAELPAPILFTTNCLMPPKDSYKDRVFTTEVVSYPGIVHIGEDKDFTPVIEKALECIEYYGGKIAGISSIFSATDSVQGHEVHSIFHSNDIEGYESYPSHECPLCSAGIKLDGLVSAGGISNIR